MKTLHRQLVAGISGALTRFQASETLVMMTMAVLVGTGGGFGAVAFRRLIEIVHTLFFGTLGDWLSFLGRLYLVIVPAVGGLVVGLLTHFVSPESRGPGVARVMEAIAVERGRICPVVIAAKPIATSITIGSGGSGGREGPIIQMGSAIGSALSQLAKLSDERTKNLVAAGAAAGIAATFNAPLAGVMFALEVLLAKFGLMEFTSMVVAAVIASVIGHAYHGDTSAFSVAPSVPPAAWELPVYAALGIVAAFVGVGFIRARYWVDDVFHGWSFPAYLRPAAGGVVVGVIGLWFPEILGLGYDSIEGVLFNRLTLTSLVALAVLKVIATSVTVGSGGSGGIFAPCLFTGAMVGGVFGQLVARATPGGTVSSAYALVGMSAVFGAASRAPITAILTLFEMTRDYSAMLPLMLSTVISAIVARHLFHESIYTVKLSQRGIDVHADRNLNLMSAILVKEAMTPIEEMTTVSPDTPVTDLVRIFDETHYHGLAVVEPHDQLWGVVTLIDLERAQARQQMSGEVRDICSRAGPNVHSVFPDETLEDALRTFGALDIGRIPVVTRSNPNRIVGMLRRGDIARAYSHAYLDKQAKLARVDRARLEQRTGENILEMKLQGGHAAVGKTVQELDLPPQSLVISIRRGGHVLIPRGDTGLESGDVVVILVPANVEEALRAELTGPARDRGRERVTQD